MKTPAIIHLPKTAGKRLLLAVTISGMAFAGIYAFAASITAGPSTLGAGSSVTSACDSSIGVTYPTPTYVDGSGYSVSQVTITGLDTTACAGKTVYVQLADGSNNLVANGSGSAAVPGTGSTVTVSLSGATSASPVFNAHVTIA